MLDIDRTINYQNKYAKRIAITNKDTLRKITYKSYEYYECQSIKGKERIKN